jgi:hypothetical protein
MHRLLAAILLAGALGGLVVFGRHLGRVPEPVAVRLSAPPPQHLTAPSAVHAPLLVTARPVTAPGSAPTALRPLEQAPTTPLTLSAAKPLTVPRVAMPATQPKPPVAKPKSKPKPPAAPAPAPPQQQVRVLAAVPLTPVSTVATTSSTPPSTPSPTAKHGNGNGHAYGQLKQAKPGKSSSNPVPPPAAVPAAPVAPAPAVPPATVVELTPVDPGAADSADVDADQVVHGHGWGRGNGKGHRG